LLDYKTQERYYTTIVDKYMSFCSDAGHGHELLKRFGSLSLKTDDSDKGEASGKDIPPNNLLDDAEKLKEVTASADLSNLIMAMRKLREGIVASKRVDAFSVQVYCFCIRLSILTKHMESYQPALLHLLRNMHPKISLSNVELQEFAGYLVLDLACRQQDLAQAYYIRSLYSLKDFKVNAILDAMSHDNYQQFWWLKRSVDGYKAKLMEFADESMRLQALKCLGRAYLNVDLDYLERITNSTWPLLISEHNVGWELKGNNVIIRKPKPR